MKKKNNKIWILVLCSIFLITAVLTKGFGLFNVGKTNSALDNRDVITIPVSEVSESAKWHEYNGRNFFTVKANDGTIKTAFDACDVCYRQRKGYRQEGDYMICNNCGNRYPVSGLGTENKITGGCWPSYLSNTIKGDNLVIRVSDLVKK